MVATSCIAMVLGACTAERRDPIPTSPPGPTMTTVHSTQCGRDVGDLVRPLEPLKLAAPGAGIGRSTRTMALDADGCADPSLASPSLERSCDPAEFPWLPKTPVRAQLLYALGVRSLMTGSYLVNGRPAVDQTVMDFADTQAPDVFREHLERCGAKPLTSSNGRPVTYQLSGDVPLAAKFAGRRLVVLQGLDGKDKSGLLD